MNRHSVPTTAYYVEETLSTQELLARASTSADPPLPPMTLLSLPLTNLAVKCLIQVSPCRQGWPHNEAAAGKTHIKG